MCVQEHAFEISPRAIAFICPFCWSKYNKDGTPSKTAKRVVHIHGNHEGTLENRVLTRASQCDVRIFKGAFRIVVSDRTARVD